MAEVALGVAGSVVGIVSLAGQVCVAVQELYAFLDSIKDAELDLKGIKDDVILLQHAIQWIHRDCTNIPEHVDTTLLRTSLELCSSRITRLLAIVGAHELTDHRKKALKKLRATVKKKRIVDFVRDLDSAKMSLMLVHQHYIRESAVKGTLGSASDRLTAVLSPDGSVIVQHPKRANSSNGENCSIDQKKPTTIIHTATSEKEYQFLVGTFSIKSRSNRSITRSDSTSITQYETEEKTFKLELARWLASFNIELQALRRWGNWTYQLRHWRVISADSLLFTLCNDGDLKNVQRLLGERLASPFDVSPEGKTVLHYAAKSGHPELVSFFLQVGADANAETISGESAFQYAMWSPREDKHLELARVFIDRGQVDPVMISGSHGQYGIIHSYSGPPETFEYMINQEKFFVGLEERNEGGKTILHHQILHRLYYGNSFQRIEILLAAGHHIIGGRITDADGVLSQFNGYTALHCAVERWSRSKIVQDERTAQQAKLVVQRMLERGENIHALSRGRRFTPLTTIGEMVANSPRLFQAEVISEWLDLLLAARYEPNEYLLTEAKLEQQRPETWPRLRLTFGEGNGHILPQISVFPSGLIVCTWDGQISEISDESAATNIRNTKTPNTGTSLSPLLRLCLFRNSVQGLLTSYMSIVFNVSQVLMLLVIMLGFSIFSVIKDSLNLR